MFYNILGHTWQEKNVNNYFSCITRTIDFRLKYLEKIALKIAYYYLRCNIDVKLSDIFEYKQPKKCLLIRYISVTFHCLILFGCWTIFEEVFQNNLTTFINTSIFKSYSLSYIPIPPPLDAMLSNPELNTFTYRCICTPFINGLNQ